MAGHLSAKRKNGKHVCDECHGRVISVVVVAPASFRPFQLCLTCAEAFRRAVKEAMKTTIIRGARRGAGAT